MSPRIPMRNRNVRVGDRLWTAALATADRRGENLAEVIRRALERYAEEGDGK